MRIQRDPEDAFSLRIDLAEELIEYRRSQVDRMVEFLQEYARTAMGRMAVRAAIRGLWNKANGASHGG